MCTLVSVTATLRYIINTTSVCLVTLRCVGLVPAKTFSAHLRLDGNVRMY